MIDKLWFVIQQSIVSILREIPLTCNWQELNSENISELWHSYGHYDAFSEVQTDVYVGNGKSLEITAKTQP